MTFEEFKQEIEEVITNRPSYYRKGQAVFNHIDEKYGVARAVQFQDGIDCFYIDNLIDRFVSYAFKRIQQCGQ